MASYDRDEVLRRTDLAELCDEVLGPRKGRGRSGSWPCPSPGHGTQTGRTPPVTVFRALHGDERWRCHACAAGGTALDLVMTTEGTPFKGALELLARRAGVAELPDGKPPLRPARILRSKPLPSAEARPEVERYVAACEHHLWSERGQSMRSWLEGRGLHEPVLRANRVGADPGPTELARASGLPRAGAAVVFPVLGPDDKAIYLQARYLHPRARKYDNPASHLVGMSPRLADMRLAVDPLDPGILLVCEGIPDALSAAQAGYRAVAVLGAGLPDGWVADGLARRVGTGHLVVAFDADEAGRAGSERLTALLAERGLEDHTDRLSLPSGRDDLNAWLKGTEASFETELAGAIKASRQVEPEAVPGLASANRSMTPAAVGVMRPSWTSARGAALPTLVPPCGDALGVDL